jgi:hypothetical protein
MGSGEESCTCGLTKLCNNPVRCLRERRCLIGTGIHWIEPSCASLFSCAHHFDILDGLFDPSGPAARYDPPAFYQ